MDKPFDNAKSILQVYLDRGLKADQAAKSGDIDSFLQLLTDRKAAFNNYRYWDYVCQQYDPSYTDSPEFQSLWQKIAALNSRIESCLAQLCDELNKELIRASHTREKLSKFRSATQTKSGFRLGV